jgi:AcrR family transcriptional regulator
VAATEQHTETQSAILAGCARALAKHGFRKLTVEDIADASGFAKRTIYLYFPNKAAVCRALIERDLELSFAELDAILEEPISGGEKLRKLLMARVLGRTQRTISYHRDLNETMRMLYPDRVAKFRSVAAPDIDRVEKAVRAGIHDGSLVASKPRLTAELLVRTTNCFLPSNLAAGDVEDLAGLNSQVAAFVEILLRGLQPR